MALGSTPVGVGPGKPTTDSGGKSEELTTAAVELVSYYLEGLQRDGTYFQTEDTDP